jgi:hypothetical protein
MAKPRISTMVALRMIIVDDMSLVVFSTVAVGVGDRVTTGARMVFTGSGVLVSVKVAVVVGVEDLKRGVNVLVGRVGVGVYVFVKVGKGVQVGPGVRIR